MAVGVENYVLIRADYNLIDCRCLEVDCVDYEHYSKLPRLVRKNGVMFGLTGWNSDRGIACYKDRVITAKAI